jgi:hypothetical protein
MPRRKKRGNYTWAIVKGRPGGGGGRARVREEGGERNG